MKSKKLQAQLEEMEQYIKNKDQLDPKVSKAPVGWHLAHSLKVIHSILDAINTSDPEKYQKKFSWMKEIVYFTGRIPRGKARAPRVAIPKENISEEELKSQIVSAKKKIPGIIELPKNAFFEHPYFGHIKRDETTKFLVIHTGHHLKIIRDILRVK